MKTTEFIRDWQEVVDLCDTAKAEISWTSPDGRLAVQYLNTLIRTARRHMRNARSRQRRRYARMLSAP